MNDQLQPVSDELRSILSTQLTSLDVTLDTPERNLALDDLLLAEVDRGDRSPVLRLWELSQTAVILGRSSRAAIDVDVDACRAAEVPVLRRSSGGGTVLLGPGCLAFSVVLRADRNHTSIQAGISFVLAIMTRAMRTLGFVAGHAGTSDLTTDDFKFSGNSQRWKKNAFLHHGTLLYDADLTLISRLLHQPERQPDYRRGRLHADFVRNLPVDVVDLKQALVDEWRATSPASIPQLGDIDEFVAKLPSPLDRP